MMQTLWRMLEDGRLNDLQRRWFEPPGEEQLYDTVADPFELDNLARRPEHRETLDRMRAALAKWQRDNPDWSERPEATMAADFWPNGAQPVTAGPSFRWQPSTLTIHCETDGASLAYRINADRWQIYTGAVRVAPGDSVQARAVRYGWGESEVARFEVPL